MKVCGDTSIVFCILVVIKMLFNYFFEINLIYLKKATHNKTVTMLSVKENTLKLERLLAIIFKLLHRSTISASQLADELNVSQRTIYRDIETISAAGIPITSYHGTNGGFGIIENYKWDKTFLDPSSMVNVLSLMKSLSEQLRDQDLKSALERLSILTLEEQKNHLQIDLAHQSVAPALLIDLQKSIKESKKVYFQYISAQKEQTTREVDPITLRYKFRTWYLYAYCYLRNDYREFKVSHILNLQRLTTSINKNHPIPEEKPFVQPLKESIILRVHPDFIHLVLNHFQHHSMTQEEDGSITVTLMLPTPLYAEWLINILLSFRSGVVVIQPLFLQDVLKNEAKKILNLYEDI